MNIGDALAQAAMQAQENQSTQPREGRNAAQQFEAVLLQQLIKVMRSTTPVLQGDQAGMYTSMIDSALADHLAAAGGIGLAAPLSPLLGAEGDGGDGAQASQRGQVHRGFLPLLTRGVAAAERYQAVAGVRPASGAPLDGATGRLQQVAQGLLSRGAENWAREGRLSEQELSSQYRTDAGDGVAHFNVRDANGYQGHPKCNLFALEVARRGGFKVPLIARGAGWGFPSADAVTSAARAGRLEWGQVVTGAQAAALDQDIAAGKRAFLLSGSGRSGRHGHMAIVERIHRIEYDTGGDIKQVEFDGWEARSRGGAQHLVRRTWNRADVQGGHMARNGFEQIEVIELQRPKAGEDVEQPQNGAAPASFLDKFFSSSSTHMPNQSSEDAS